jgi:hypothetical protein
MPTTSVTALIEDFARQIITATEAAAAARVQAALAAAFGTPPRRAPGRPKKALAPAMAPGKRGKRKAPKATAALVRARKLQGQYLGALRGLSPADRAKVKSLAKAKGVPAAVKLALTLKRKA